MCTTRWYKVKKKKMYRAINTLQFSFKTFHKFEKSISFNNILLQYKVSYTIYIKYT